MSVQKSTIDRFSMPRPRLGAVAAPRHASSRLPARLRARPAGGLTGRTGPGPAGPVPTSRALRAAFTVLEHQPRLGGRFAEWLWFRLPAPPSAEERAQRTPTGGEPFEVAWSGGTVRGRVYGDWGLPTAYLVHGWGGWWQQLGAHVQPLVDRGLCVVAFDAPSHGDSPRGRFGPRSTTFPEMAEALTAVVADFGRPTLVVAHSAGAMAALRALDSGDVRPQALVLIAPPASVDPMLAFFADTVAVGKRSRAVMVERAERRVGLPMGELDLVTLAARQRTLPALLVVHDHTDREAPFEGAVRLTTAWHGARLHATESLGHRRVLSDPAVVERVAELAAAAAERLSRPSR